MIYVINSASETPSIALTVTEDNLIELAILDRVVENLKITVPSELGEAIRNKIQNSREPKWMFTSEVGKFTLPTVKSGDTKITYDVRADVKHDKIEFIKYDENPDDNHSRDIIIVVSDNNNTTKTYLSPKTFGAYISTTAFDSQYKVAVYIPFRNKWNTFYNPAWISVVQKVKGGIDNVKGYQLTTFINNFKNKNIPSNTIKTVGVDVIEALRKVTKTGRKHEFDNKTETTTYKKS